MKRNPTAFLKQEYQALVDQGFDWRLKTLESANQPHSKVAGKDIIMLTANNYLNLSTHPKLIEATIEATKKYGAGAGAVPAISAYSILQKQFEERLAKFKGVEAGLLCQTGFAVNSGVIPTLVGEGDLVISDELNHGSIIDGVRLTKAERAIYKHADVSDLERVLKEAEAKPTPPRRILVITDGVFSMDGDIAPMKGIVEACEAHGAMVYVDDCHGEGVLGDGKGIVHHFRLQGRVHVEGGCMSKAFGVFGGTVAGSRDLVNFALNKSRTWLLSTAHPPGVIAANIAALDVVDSEPQLVKSLWENTNYFLKEVQSLGFNTGNSQTPIIPAITGDPKTAKALSEEMFNEGVFAFPIVFPMVAKEKSRIRMQISAKLTREDLNVALAALEKSGKKLKII